MSPDLPLELVFCVVSRSCSVDSEPEAKRQKPSDVVLKDIGTFLGVL